MTGSTGAPEQSQLLEEKDSPWEVSSVANLVRWKASKVYFARLKVNGKLIRKSLQTKLFSVAKNRLADLVKDERNRAEQGERMVNGKMVFADATKIYLQRLDADPGIKPRTKVYRRECIKAVVKTWPGIDELDVRKINKTACIDWAARFREKGTQFKPIGALKPHQGVSPSRFNNTVATLRQILDIPVEMGALYSEELARFGGYRGLFMIVGSRRQRRAFDWTGEFQAGAVLPANNQIVIYEMPIKWMASDPTENPLVELGTIDKVIFEHLDDLDTMGINCIELLPIEDSPQTLNWGYGTRFFYAPDYDVASAVDLKFFVKECHSRGIRVILDVVMNMFDGKCPLAALAPNWFATPSTPYRLDYGQELFLYNSPSYGIYYAAREFLCEMAEYWVSQYHIDGFRIDDFNDIGNWDFVQEFHDRATAASKALDPSKPFLVVAEDSPNRFVATSNDPQNPSGRKVVDAIWNFRFRDEARRLLTDSIFTSPGQAARSLRVQHLISKDGPWDDYPKTFTVGYIDLSCAVDYITSHDVADAPRLMNVILGPMLQARGLGDGGIANVAWAVTEADNLLGSVQQLVSQAALRVFGGFAIMMTSVGIPMFLAGEEFGDVHDIDYVAVNPKQQDPVQWLRAQYTANSQLKTNVAKLIQLRTTHPALQRNEVQAFYFHPQFDNNAPASRVFAYCRTAGQSLGSSGQVIVIANMGSDDFMNFDFPQWPWTGMNLRGIGYPAIPPVFNAGNGSLSLSLPAFSTRVFTT